MRARGAERSAQADLGAALQHRHVAVAAMRRRVFIAQSLYAFATVLCLINTYVSITLIVLVQLNYAIAPRIPLLNRL